MDGLNGNENCENGKLMLTFGLCTFVHLCNFQSTELSRNSQIIIVWKAILVHEHTWGDWNVRISFKCAESFYLLLLMHIKFKFKVCETVIVVCSSRITWFLSNWRRFFSIFKSHIVDVHCISRHNMDEYLIQQEQFMNEYRRRIFTVSTQPNGL